MKKRKYTLKQRGAQQQETRERIVDAAMALHEELGPAATTISALAERAGVQRLTVYRHFADGQAILQACSAKWFGLHPPPDISTLPPGAPAERTQAILHALYAYYQKTQGMWRSLYRDLQQMEELEEPMRQFDDYLAAVGTAVLANWPRGRSKRLRATVSHALRYSTWQSLHEQGLSGNMMAALVCTWIRAASA
jgi:AcrR family transcriptional regulator